MVSRRSQYYLGRHGNRPLQSFVGRDCVLQSGSSFVGRNPLHLRTPPNAIRLSPIVFAPFALIALFFNSAKEHFDCNQTE